MPTTSAQGSPWLSDDIPASAPALGSLAADVAVIGAGITGATTALLLAQAGLEVVICEAGRAASGVTGLNTAKVTALQGTVYSELRSKVGLGAAAQYAAASAAGVQLLVELAEAYAPDAGLRRRTAATIALTRDETDAVHAETEAARAAGLPVYATTDVDTSLPVHAAVCLDDQLSLHPVRYVRGLLAAAIEAGARLHEHSRVVDVGLRGPHVVRTDSADITAGHVVIATHYPMLDRGGYFARLEARRSYCVAGRIRDDGPDAMVINAGEPVRSFAAVDGLAILGGEGHAAGERNVGPERFDSLEQDLRAWSDISGDLFRWSAQDAVSVDRLPVIGSYLPGARSLWVASGFGKWGLSTGTVAARILADRILGRENAWAATFRPARFHPRSSTTLAKLAGKVALDLIGDRLRPGEVDSLDAVAPGTAAVLRRGHRQLGVYRDVDGGVHGVSLRCTHMGCLLRFNAAETSWDCPCHGSRFDVDGGVLEGPAVHPLGREEL